MNTPYGVRRRWRCTAARRAPVLPGAKTFARMVLATRFCLWEGFVPLLNDEMTGSTALLDSYPFEYVQIRLS
eukprot:6072486-Pleurochrysis_carterae.AAC.1